MTEEKLIKQQKYFQQATLSAFMPQNRNKQIIKKEEIIPKLEVNQRIKQEEVEDTDDDEYDEEDDDMPIPASEQFNLFNKHP